MNKPGDLCGPSLVREPRSRYASARRRFPSGKAIAAVAVSISIALAAIMLVSLGNSDALRASTSGQATLGVVLQYQFKDTIMPCVPEFGAGAPAPAHPMWHVPGPDGIYGTVDDCPHCSCYCAPASISMIAAFRMMPAPSANQDDIYDAAELEIPAGEVPLDMIIQREGVGMCDGTGGFPPEVQAAFSWSLGGLFIQHDFAGMGNVPLTPQQLELYIDLGHPILWLDHSGWPVNMSENYPDYEYRQNQGHAKVIAGYDDKDTADFGDDTCLIYDPWPEYNQRMILPVNATQGPGNTWDPYWLPLNDVNLSDPADIYLVDTFPDIPEFDDLLVPVRGLVMAVSAIGYARRKRP